MLFKTFTYLLVCTLVLISCKSQKPGLAHKNKSSVTSVIGSTVSKLDKEDKPTEIVHPRGDTKNSVASYIEKYTAVAKDKMVEYGIPASITIAQGILESGAGKGELSQKANNHFGIKCHKGWTGQRVYHDDDEDQECFRKYENPESSFRDHSLFLSERSRYSGLFELSKDDYKAWAKGLRKAGYATDPRYPQKLITIIEKYDLSELDRSVLGKKKKKKKKKKNENGPIYTVKAGDTLYSISRKNNIEVWQLKKYNDLRSNEISIGQELYLDARSN